MNDSNVYLTKFTGEISLDSLDESKRAELYPKIEALIKTKLEDMANLDKETNMFYLGGEIDNTEGIMENVMHLLSSIIVVEEDIVIVAQGSDPKDRWDLIIKTDGVYIQEYEFCKGDLKKWN